MSDPLASARVKLKRANLHVGLAYREMMRFFKSHEQPAIGAEAHGEPSPLTPGSEFAFRLVIQGSAYPELPDSFAARFGDALHNYRCVLDHIAWQLTCHGKTPTPSLNERAQRAIQFPAYNTEAAFKKHVATRLPGVAQPVIDFVHARYAYDRGKATNEALLALAALSNDDKHRTIQTFASALAGVQHDHVFTRCEPLTLIPPPTPPKLEPKAVIATITVRVLGPDPKVDVGLTPQLYVVLEDGRPMLKLLYEIREQVHAILNAPEIAAALA